MKHMDYSVFLERYLEGEMEPSEERWFKKELEGNEALQKELRLRQQVEKALAEPGILELRSRLAEIGREETMPAPQKRLSRKRMITAAVTLALLISAGTFLLKQNAGPTGQEIFEEYFEAADPILKTRTAGAKTNDLYRKAVAYYSDGEFEKAKQCFKQVLETRENDMESHLYKGISEMKTEEFNEGERSFKTVIDQGDNLFIEDAHWYLSLCYIVTGEEEKAIPHLDKIKKEKGPHSSDARKIVKKIR